MPGGKGNIRPEDRTNGFEKNPQNINKKGRRKIRPLRDFLNDLSDTQDTITVPLDQCEIDEKNKVVNVKIPSKEKIALMLQKKAYKDVRWFAEWAKVMGEYAPTNFNVFQSMPKIEGITFDDEN